MSEYKTKIHAHKQDSVGEIKEVFGSFSDYIFTDYRGLTVAQITDLRRQLRKKNAEYKVLKNNYARIALEQLECPDVSTYLVGPTAVALAKDDTGEVAKILLDFGKETAVKVKGGLISRSVFDSKQVEAFSKLPGRKELIAMLMGTMKAPVQNLVFAMNGVASKLVRTLQAVADKKAAQ